MHVSFPDSVELKKMSRSNGNFFKNIQKCYPIPDIEHTSSSAMLVFKRWLFL